MFHGNDAGDPQTTYDGSDAALPRKIHRTSSSIGHFESETARKARHAREETEWRAKNGPVRIRKVKSPEKA